MKKCVDKSQSRQQTSVEVFVKVVLALSLHRTLTVPRFGARHSIDVHAQRILVWTIDESTAQEEVDKAQHPQAQARKAYSGEARLACSGYK
jgi:hypothetical protein